MCSRLSMRARVLVTRAGSGAASNLIQSLRRGDAGLRIAGCHDDPFILKKSTASTNYLIPTAANAGFPAALRRVIQRERIDLVIPVTDPDVEAVSRIRRRLGARVFLPRPAALTLCRDKLAVALLLAARNVPVPASYPVTSLDALGRVFKQLPRGKPAWCRARRGAGSFASAPVDGPARARAWIDLWCASRRVPPTAFMLAEYLPGRDYACQSLWKDGELLLIKTTERLAYADGSARLSGTSSVGSVHKSVRDERLVTIARQAVLAVDRQATGAFSVDLKENAIGQPCVTEINAGRLLSGTTIFDTIGAHNMAATYLRLGIGRTPIIRRVYDSPEGYYMARDLDTPPHLFDEKEFWRGWVDAR